MKSLPLKADAAKLRAPDPAYDKRQLDVTEQKPKNHHGQIVTCTLDQLRPHPSYVRHKLRAPASQISALVSAGDFAFRDPLVVTRDGVILDGWARWELAWKQGRPTLPCIEYDLSEIDALYWLLQRHRRCAGLNDYCRILLALDLEPSLKEKAKANQQAGGQNKGSSNLTEAQRLDVREAIASAAGVSTANVSKVKQLERSAHPEILQALRTGEVRIHRAWLWSKLSVEKQPEKLLQWRNRNGVERTIRNLISQHKLKVLPEVPAPGNLLNRLAALAVSGLAEVSVRVIDVPGRAVFITKELSRDVGPQQESLIKCAKNSL